MKFIFWDVDTQRDFMLPGGKLYVKGAEEILGKLEKLTTAAHKRGIQIVASADAHEAGDPELSNYPNYESTFPPHCMAGTNGAEMIKETILKDPMVIETGKNYKKGDLQRILYNHDGDFLLTKKKFDVFSNPNTETLLEILSPTDIVVYGVALDFCVAQAVEGLLKRGNYRIHLLEDATRPINPKRSAALIGDWCSRGVNVTTCDKWLSYLNNPFVFLRDRVVDSVRRWLR